MKRIIALTLTLFISSVTFAGSSTNTVRATSGQLISVGDSLTEMMTRINQSPISMNSYEVKQGEITITASDYAYDIDNVIYTFTIINNQVRKIEWVRKDS